MSKQALLNMRVAGRKSAIFGVRAVVRREPGAGGPTPRRRIPAWTDYPYSKIPKMN